MAQKISLEISGRGFNASELLDDSKYWSCTLIYDQDKLTEGGEKCLEILEKVKNLPKENNVRIIKPTSPGIFQCINYGGNYKGKKYDNASFISSLFYYELLNIFGLNSNQELDISNPTPEQELEVCKCIMKDLWLEYKSHIL